MIRLCLAVLCAGLLACDPLEPTTPQAPDAEEEVEGTAPHDIRRISVIGYMNGTRGLG